LYGRRVWPTRREVREAETGLGDRIITKRKGTKKANPRLGYGNEKMFRQGVVL